MTVLANTATFAASMNFALTVFSSWTGWLAPTLGILVALKSGTLVDRLIPESISEENPKFVGTVSMALGIGTITGVAYFSQNLEIIGTWIAGQSVNLTASLLNSAYSRCHEYQADRLAAEATGDPKTVAETLKKVDAYSRELSYERDESERPHAGIIRRVFKEAKILFASHPQIEKRVRRLERRAKNLDQAHIPELR